MSVFQTQYRNEYIDGFEQRKSLVLSTVTTEAQIKGNSCVFMVNDSGGNRATTRGANGRIPAAQDNQAQYTATLEEFHDLRERTGFNIFASQGDGRKAMQENSLAVLNREIDQNIITQLNTGTQDTGAATTANLSLVMYAVTILGNNAVPMDGNISALISPAFHAYLMQTKEFASVDYVNNKPFAGMMLMYRWAGVNFIVHPNLPGKATNAEKCFVYHKNAIGHAVDTKGLSTFAGYDEQQDYSWARTTCYMGSKLLQNSGVVVVNHDGSNFVAQ